MKAGFSYVRVFVLRRNWSVLRGILENPLVRGAWYKAMSRPLYGRSARHIFVLHNVFICQGEWS